MSANRTPSAGRLAPEATVAEPQERSVHGHLEANFIAAVGAVDEMQADALDLRGVQFTVHEGLEPAS